MASSDKKNAQSDPISIPFSAARGRARSMSVSSSSSSSTSSGSDLPTPASTSVGSQRLSIPSPSTSPILSYFLAQSPTTKTPATATFPFKRKFGPSPVFEEGEPETEIPVAAHARRASASVRFNPQNTASYSEASTDRGSNLLRRLSLSSAAFVKPHQGPETHSRVSPPSPPPNSAVTPTSPSYNPPFTHKPRRSTLAADAQRPRRAPSPMGERILTGHFDGFN